MPGNTSSQNTSSSEDALTLERCIQTQLLTGTAQEPANASDLETPHGAPDAEIAFSPSPTDKQWNSTNEQEWSEHSATAWALAYVIHRIRSTPLPPILLPEQRRHFQKVIQMAAALTEEWQRRERDQAQQLAGARPPIGPLMDTSEMRENNPGDASNAGEIQSSEPLIEPQISLPQRLTSDLSPENMDKYSADTKDETR